MYPRGRQRHKITKGCISTRMEPVSVSEKGYVYLRMYTCTQEYVKVFTCVCVYVSMLYVCVCVCVCVCVFELRIYACMHACMRTCTCKYVHVCI